ncbi:MAG: cupin domain-containing protein [Ginsengibacter sp.]
MNANYLISHLQLEPHPEGGFFKEYYRASETIAAEALPSRFAGERNFSTAIYYLLRQGERSLFHRIKSDECWHFYSGDTLLLHVLEPAGKYYCIKLGSNIYVGETFQFVVPSSSWFAAEPAKGTDFSLCGCTVAPGFDFADFELADKQELLDSFPECDEIISRLCKE